MFWHECVCGRGRVSVFGNVCGKMCKCAVEMLPTSGQERDTVVVICSMPEVETPSLNVWD